MTRRDRSDRATRRTVLKATGIAGVTASLGGLAAGQDTTEEGEDEGQDETTEETTVEGEGATTILLGGEVDYWFGLAPEPIQGEENPTLALEEGERYEIIWMNLDGREHELVVEDADGEELEASDSNEEAGATASVTVTAGEEMAEYYCEYHPESMRGNVELGEGFETTQGTETETAPEGTETTVEDESDDDPY